MGTAYLSLPVLALLLSLSAPAKALLPAQVSLGVALQFPLSSTVLTSSHENILAAAVHRVKTEQWCNVQVAVAVGYADAAEGINMVAQRISEERAHGAATHLVHLGLSPSIVYTEGQGVRRPSAPVAAETNALVEIQVVGYPPSGGCPYRLGNNGFWR